MTTKLSKIRFLIHNKTFFKTFRYRRFRKKAHPPLDPNLENQYANYKLNYKYDCTNPRTFNEHLGWIKFNYRNELWKLCSDKLGSKKFLTDHGFGQYVVKTLKVYKDVSEIDLNELPENFVLKTNNDSGTVFNCDKKTTNFDEVFAKITESLHKEYSSSNGEWVYDDIKPCVFAEEELEPRVGKLIVDYKLFGFNGHFGWGFTGQNREIDTRFVVFEKDFDVQKVEYIYLRPRKKYFPVKPKDFNKMVEITEEISKILDFVRVDFYDTSEGIKIGELTFFSQSGRGSFTKNEYDFKYGKFFKFTKLGEMIKK